MISPNEKQTFAAQTLSRVVSNGSLSNYSLMNVFAKILN